MNRVTAIYDDPKTGQRLETGPYESYSCNMIDQYGGAASRIEAEHGIKVDINKVRVRFH